MESHDTLTTTPQCDTIDKLLESDDAINYLPNWLRKFFLAARNSTSLEAIEQAIEAYKKANNNNKGKCESSKGSYEDIRRLLNSSAATNNIPDNILKVLKTWINYATTEIIQDLIKTFKKIKHTTE